MNPYAVGFVASAIGAPAGSAATVHGRA